MPPAGPVLAAAHAAVPSTGAPGRHVSTDPCEAGQAVVADHGPGRGPARREGNGTAPKTPHWSSTLTVRQTHILTFAGLALAGLGEAYLQLAQPTNRAKAVGLACLALGAILFGLGGLGGLKHLLPADLQRPRLPALPPLQVLGGGPATVAAGVGGLSFLVLIVRLLIGSTAGSDLVLWAVAIAAFVIALVGEVSPWRPSRAMLLTFGLEAGAVAAVVLLVVVALAWDVNHWYYSAIGDEYAFLSQANGVLNDGVQRPFAQDGVYGAHPQLGSIFQAAVMRVFGHHHFGWIMSSILSHALTIPAVYLIGRLLAGRGVGILAAVMFGVCHYLFAFSHIGYNNIMAQAPTAYALAFFLAGLRFPRAWLLFASGVAAGLGFYTFYSARTTLPILGLIVLLVYGWRACLTPRGVRDRFAELWPLGLGFVLAAAPIFAASGMSVILRMFNEVPGGYSQQITGPPGQKIAFNFWLNVPAYFQQTHVAHYVSGSLLDPVTAALAALGIGLAVRWWSNAGMKLVLVWAVVGIAVTALLSPHPTTAVTRLLFGVPPLAILAALAARRVWAMIPWPSSVAVPRWAAAGAVVALALVVVGLNLQRFWVTTPRAMHLTQDAIVVGALRSPLCGPDTGQTVVVMRGHGLLRGALNSYHPRLAERDLPRLVVQSELTPGEPIPLDSARCVVFGDPNDEPAKQAMNDLKQAHPGSEIVPFKDLSGKASVMVFLPPGRTTGVRRSPPSTRHADSAPDAVTRGSAPAWTQTPRPATQTGMVKRSKNQAGG